MTEPQTAANPSWLWAKADPMSNDYRYILDCLVSQCATGRGRWSTAARSAVAMSPLTLLTTLLAASLIASCSPSAPQHLLPSRAESKVSITTPPTTLWSEPDSVPRTRRFSTLGWDTIAIVEIPALSAMRPGTARLVADGQGFILVGQQQLTAFDLRGAVRWRTDASAFANIRDVKIAADGQIVVGDFSQQHPSIVFLDPARGTVRTRWPITVADPGLQFAPQPDGSVIGFVLRFNKPIRVFVNSQQVDTIAFPWSGFEKINDLARQGVIGIDRHSARWVFAFLLGDGWFAFDGRSVLPFNGRNIEHTEFPAVVETVSRGSKGAELAHSPYAAKYVALSGPLVSVWFGGVSENADRIVDQYEFSSGHYAGSLLLPTRPAAVSIADTLYYVMHRDSLPGVLVLTPRRMKK